METEGSNRIGYERNGVKADNKKGDKRERVGNKKEKERGWK